MPKTQLEQYDILLSSLSKDLDEAKNRLQSCNKDDPSARFFKEDIERMTERLSFLQEQRDKIAASGKTYYVYDFGTLEDFRQTFEDSKYPEDLFITLSRSILERNNVPSKKVKQIGNLIKVYDEVRKKTH